MFPLMRFTALRLSYRYSRAELLVWGVGVAGLQYGVAAQLDVDGTVQPVVRLLE